METQKNTSEMDVQAGNKLIAEFMGATLHETFDSYNNATYKKLGIRLKPLTTIPTEKRDRLKELKEQNIFDPKYHTSWDWLRPVIDEIFKYSLAHPEEAGKVCKMSIVVNIDAAWEKVTQFILWYNKTQQSK